MNLMGKVTLRLTSTLPAETCVKRAWPCGMAEQCNRHRRKGEHCLAFELKAHPAPKLTKGFYIAIEDLKPLKSFVVCTSNELYPMAEDIWVGPLLLVLEQIRKDYGL